MQAQAPLDNPLVIQTGGRTVTHRLITDVLVPWQPNNPPNPPPVAHWHKSCTVLAHIRSEIHVSIVGQPSPPHHRQYSELCARNAGKASPSSTGLTTSVPLPPSTVACQGRGGGGLTSDRWRQPGGGGGLPLPSYGGGGDWESTGLPVPSPGDLPGTLPGAAHRQRHATGSTRLIQQPLGIVQRGDGLPSDPRGRVHDVPLDHRRQVIVHVFAHGCLLAPPSAAAACAAAAPVHIAVPDAVVGGPCGPSNDARQVRGQGHGKRAPKEERATPHKTKGDRAWHRATANKGKGRSTMAHNSRRWHQNYNSSAKEPQANGASTPPPPPLQPLKTHLLSQKYATGFWVHI